MPGLLHGSAGVFLLLACSLLRLDVGGRSRKIQPAPVIRYSYTLVSSAVGHSTYRVGPFAFPPDELGNRPRIYRPLYKRSDRVYHLVSIGDGCQLSQPKRSR